MGYSWGLRSSAAIEIGRSEGEPNTETLTFLLPIILEQQVEYKAKIRAHALLDGYHRRQAYIKYNEGHAERLKTLRDGETIPEPFDVIPVEYHVKPEGIPPRLYSLFLNTAHGLKSSDADRKAVARETYEDNLGFPLKTLCAYMKITHRKARGYVEDLLAKFEDDKNSVMMRLSMLGWTQEEISEKLQQLWPDAKGDDTPVRFKLFAKKW